jgi:hypothetical protein
MNVISIVPRLPPAVDGVGDYAVRLAQEARKKLNLDTLLIAAGPLAKSNPSVEGFNTTSLTELTADDFLSCLSSLTSDSHQKPLVLIHYTFYGYSRFGCPYWLLNGLKQWKKLFPSAKVTIMFHEIHNIVKMKPWKHGFWTPIVQKRIASELVELADQCITSNAKYAAILSGISGRRDIEILPVFSTIAEPIVVTDFTERKNQIVVFGQTRRREAYKSSWEHISKVCEILNIEEIIDIGPELDISIPSYIHIPIRQMGQLDVHSISTILCNAQVGFINYSDESLVKSSVFATYCSHGMLPICHKASTMDGDNLVSGVNYINTDFTQIDFEILNKATSISRHAYEWYQRHKIETQIAKIHDLEIH